MHGRARVILLVLLASFASVLLFGCMPYELRAILDGPQGKALSISPSATVVPANNTIGFTGVGGVGPYVYSLVSGGGSVDPVTGVYTAPVSAGSAVIRVTDKTGKTVDAAVTIQVFATGLAISPSAITLSIGGSITFVAIGGTGPYTWGIQTAGSGSPAINPSGVYVAGSTPNTFDVVRLTDSASPTPITVTATVTVTPLTTVDYSVPATSFLATGMVGTAIPGGQSFTLKNNGTSLGTTPVDWKVYLSANILLDGGDTLIASGTVPALAAGASVPVALTGNFPAVVPGPYYLIVAVSSAEDTTPLNNISAASPLTLIAPPQPDYTASFNAGIPWSGLVGTAMSLTGTPQMTIQNLSVNPGYANINWAVYLSTDNVLDAGDTLVQQGTVGPLAGSGSTPVSFAGNWPAAPGQLYFLIATVQSTDDSSITNNVVIAPHACAIGDYQYVEGAENNSGVGPTPPPGQTSTTGVTTLGANQTIAIEGVMDAYIGAVSQYDTYKFATVASMSRLSIRAMWGTGYDDIDLFLWDTGTTNLGSIEVGVNSEPGAGTFDVTGVTPRTCYISANFWLANNTSGSGGQKYVILVRGLP